VVRRQRRVLARQNGSKWRDRVALFARIALCSNGVNVVSRSRSARTTRIAAEIWGPPRSSTHAKSPNIVRSFGSGLEKNRRSAARDHADAGNVTQVRAWLSPAARARRRVAAHTCAPSRSSIHHPYNGFSARPPEAATRLGLPLADDAPPTQTCRVGR
jgi:hypothetical protein